MNYQKDSHVKRNTNNKHMLMWLRTKLKINQLGETHFLTSSDDIENKLEVLLRTETNRRRTESNKSVIRKTRTLKIHHIFKLG